MSGRPTPRYLQVGIGQGPVRRINLRFLRPLMPLILFVAQCGCRARMEAEQWQRLRRQLPLLFRYSAGLRVFVSSRHTIHLAIIQARLRPQPSRVDHAGRSLAFAFFIRGLRPPNPLQLTDLQPSGQINSLFCAAASP